MMSLCSINDNYFIIYIYKTFKNFLIKKKGFENNFRQILYIQRREFHFNLVIYNDKMCLKKIN
jgi:hypothetical protein